MALTVYTYTEAKAWKDKQAQSYQESLAQDHPASRGSLTPGSESAFECAVPPAWNALPPDLFASLLLILPVPVQMSSSLITASQAQPHPIPRSFHPLPCFIFQVHLPPDDIVLSTHFPDDSAFGLSAPGGQGVAASSLLVAIISQHLACSCPNKSLWNE